MALGSLVGYPIGSSLGMALGEPVAYPTVNSLGMLLFESDEGSVGTLVCMFLGDWVGPLFERSLVDILVNPIG